MNRRLDILTVKSPLDRPTRASWKAIKTQADGILARHSGSLAFRIFADYSRFSTSQSAAEAVLAQAARLLKDDENPEMEHGLSWGTPRKPG